MSTTQHTPGPWTILPPCGEGDFGVLSNKVNAGGNFYVATLPNGSHAESAANARLIAAAPDLLAALRTRSNTLRGVAEHLSTLRAAGVTFPAHLNTPSINAMIDGLLFGADSSDFLVAKAEGCS